MNRERVASRLARQIDLMRLIEARRRRHPSDDYIPHSVCRRGPSLPEDAAYSRVGEPSGQEQFHEAGHSIRIMAPGNGWGGTLAMGVECDAWARHTGRWQETPPWPVRMIWFAPKYQQFAVVREELVDRAFGAAVRWTESGLLGPRFIWPDGSWLAVGSYESSWRRWQGVQIDLVCFDEVPPLPLWREMMVRRRGQRRTRYLCKATQSVGWNWMAEEIYRPWLDHHRRLGIDERRAVIEQRHPDIWLWPCGGIHDNPHVSDEDVAFQERAVWSSRRERKVRLFGGFESFVGDSVFDEDALAKTDRGCVGLL